MDNKNYLFAFLGSLVITTISYFLAAFFKLDVYNLVTFAALFAVLKLELEVADLRKKIKL